MEVLNSYPRPELLSRAEELVVLGGCGLLLVIIVLLSASHAGRLLMECTLVLLRHARNEWRSWTELLNQLKNELMIRRKDE